MKSKGLFIKLLVTAILVGVFLLAWGYDTLRAKEYELEIVYISNKTPQASQKDYVDFDVLVTRKGVPCKGHEVEARCSAGSFKAYLNKTDENGIVSFRYYPYVETPYQKAGPVDITLIELSNSLLVEVNVKYEFSDIVVQSVK